MILVDAGVWIDYFRGIVSTKTDLLDDLLGEEMLATGDLILTEVLQGFTQDREFNTAKDLLSCLDVVELGGEENALQAARNYRSLRKLGLTVRKTIDTVIATYCIENGCKLLYEDRDFDPFVKHLGLRVIE